MEERSHVDYRELRLIHTERVYVRRRATTRVDGRRCASTPTDVDARRATDVDALGVNEPLETRNRT